jgi:hypothetical protein
MGLIEFYTSITSECIKGIVRCDFLGASDICLLILGNRLQYDANEITYDSE